MHLLIGMEILIMADFDPKLFVLGSGFSISIPKTDF